MIFCAVCLLPTLVVGTAVIVFRTPLYRAAQADAWQRWLSSQLGVEVQLAEIRACGGRRWLAGGLECRDPESHAWLVRVRSADIARTARGWQVLLGQPQVNVRHLSRLAALVHERVMQHSHVPQTPIQLASAAVELTDESRSESILDVRSAMDAQAAGAELLLEFRTPTSAPDERMRMRFVRNRQLDPPASGWELHTDAAGLPCSVALPWLPALRHLGAACVFQGSVWCEQRPAGWDAELRGTFRAVDLQQLVTRQFPHKLSGSAEFTLRRCTIDAGRVTDVQGRLVSAGGMISQSLLDAAAQTLGLTLYARAAADGLLAYQDLAVDFSLSAAGLVLAPPGSPDAPLLTDRDGPLLSVRDRVPRSPLSLVHLLVPQVDMQVPATRETAAIVQALPLPELSVRPATAQRATYSTLELVLPSQRR